MPDRSTSDRRSLLSLAGGVAAATLAPASTALATSFEPPHKFDAVRAIAELEAIDDYEAQCEALKAFSRLLRRQYNLMLVHDYTVADAANCLADYRDPNAFLRRHGVLDHHGRWTEQDLREALTGVRQRPLIMRDGEGSEM